MLGFPVPRPSRADRPSAAPQWASAARHRTAGSRHHETHLPSLQDSPRSHAWFSCPHENAWWTRRDQRPARQGPQAPGALTASARLSAGKGRESVPTHRVLRIRASSDFEFVLRSAPLARTAHFALHGCPGPKVVTTEAAAKIDDRRLSTGSEQLDHTLVDKGQRWLGVAVPKRFARRAVTRSLLKRQARAAAVRHVDRLGPGLWVIRQRAAFPVAVYPAAASAALEEVVRGELDALLAAATQRRP